jgi:mannose-6-phosphate isomerase-like protein (cupin superfamily)
MTRGIVGGAALALALAPASLMAQGPPKAAIDITAEQIQEINKLPGTDRQIRVVDMGTYNLAVGIIHRGPTGGARAGGGGAGRAGAAGRGRGNAPAPERCGVSSGTPAGASGIAHDDTTETYYIVSGSGTLVTGGEIMNGTRSGPDSTVTKILNGPSCSGQIVGNAVKRVVKTGDVIIIPAGVPHGWTSIADHVDYLSVRPDMHKVLPSGYVNPDLK